MCNASNEKSSIVLDKNGNNIFEMAKKRQISKKQGVEGGGGWERPMDEKVDVEKLESGEPHSSSHININKSSNMNININIIIYNSSNINVNID